MSTSEMYGNYYDYGDPDLTDLRSATKDIMTDTRDAVSSIKSAGTDVYEKVSAGMGGRLEDVGVGRVKSYLNSAYKPFLNDTTTDYRTFMADTPQKIQDNIAATQVAYNAGRADRMRGFQDLLKEVKSFTYSRDNYQPATNPGPGAQAPAAAELSSISKMPKFRDGNQKKVDRSMKEFKNLFGNKFRRSDYDSLIEAGIKPGKINKELMKYNKAGGKIGKGAFKQMGYDVVDPNKAGGIGPYISNFKGNLIVPKDKGSFDWSGGLFG